MSGLHKDFHGYHNFILGYVEKKYGRRFMIYGMRRIGQNVYASVAQRLVKEGLTYLADYWKQIFELEEGKFSIDLKEDQMVLKVEQCPAVSWIAGKNWTLAPSFCEHCKVINEEICDTAGYECSIEYEQQKGCCVQRFRRKGVTR